MRRWAFETDGRDAEIGENDPQLLHAVAAAAYAPAAPDDLTEEAPAPVVEPAPEAVLPPAVDPDSPYLTETAPELVVIGPQAAPAAPAGLVTSDGIEIAQILRDRPDVFAAFFTEYYGAGNDRHSDAWANRVGGATVEAYAGYWYETYGKYGGYVAGSSGGAYNAPVEESELVFTGRTTFNGIPLSQILHDRPDVYRAFFTEYYGANNDRHSDAWQNRVGGATVEDYANYWYERYGKYGAYQPSTPSSPSVPEPTPEPVPTDPDTTAPPEVMDLGEPADDAALTVGQALADPSQSLFG